MQSNIGDRFELNTTDLMSHRDIPSMSKLHVKCTILANYIIVRIDVHRTHPARQTKCDIIQSGILDFLTRFEDHNIFSLL